MSRRRIAVVGDCLLDRDVVGTVERVCPDAPAPVLDERGRRARPGGAGLAAALAAADGHDVVLVTGLGDDGAAAELGELLEAAGVRVADLGLRGPTPEKVRVRADDRTLVRIDRGGDPSPLGCVTRAARDAVAGADAVLVSDYGRGVAAQAELRALVAEAAARRPVVWDPHPRGPAPVAGTWLATPNVAEAARFADVAGDGVAAHAARAEALRERWRADAVAVTLGRAGAVLAAGGEPLVAPAAAIAGGDPCGAGDRFASAAAGCVAAGGSLAEAVALAVRRATAFVAAGGAAAAALDRSHPPDDRPSAPSAGAVEELLARVRARGGTVVATGGCFDLLHAGHVATLHAARALGDCLVVCLNSDESVRRLKGPDRPLVTQDDRAAVLEALACVDAVVVFDEDTPAAVLARLRPDVWAKGGDYAGAELPEASVLRDWGGRAVVLPYLAGRSTTRLIEEATGGAR
jgi:D-beta-D-heptose 7-phosphate kinase/D-beta-D-heptose 1-phosphate adenosyltransferase